MKVCRIISLMLVLCVIMSVLALNAVSADNLANSALNNAKITDVLYVLSDHSDDSDDTFGDIIESDDVIQLNENLAYYKDGGSNNSLYKTIYNFYRNAVYDPSLGTLERTVSAPAWIEGEPYLFKPLVSYDELHTGDIVVFLGDRHIGIFAGQDSYGNDIMIHDHDKVEVGYVSDINPSTPALFLSAPVDNLRFIVRDNDVNNSEANNPPMVSRHASPSDTEESTEVSTEVSTADELPKTPAENPTGNTSSKSPMTGHTSQVAMIILLMFLAIIGIGVSVCKLSKKRG